MITTLPHCPACGRGPSVPLDDREALGALASVSTSTEAQEQRIIDALRSGPKTTDQLRAIGCYQVSARIFKLRALGYVIETELFTGYASDGLKHTRMARYTLLRHEDPTTKKEGPHALEHR